MNLLKAACIATLATLVTTDAAGAPRASPQDAHVVRFILGDNWSPPMAHFEGGRLTGGVIKDFLDALQRQAGPTVTVAVDVLPRGRTERALQDGQFDLSCFLAPAFLAAPERLRWGAQPIMSMQNVLIGHAGTQAIESLQALPAGTRVGTARGYRYPELAPLFDAGALVRDDAPDEVRQIRMLIAGRVDYAILKRHTVRWALGEPALFPSAAARIAPWQLPLSNLDVYCAVPRGSTGRGDRLLTLAAAAAASDTFRASIR